jgi:hypothetical protein
MPFVVLRDWYEGCLYVTSKQGFLEGGFDMKMIKMLLIAIAVLLVATPAYPLDIPLNSANIAFPGPYLNVNINFTGTQADFIVTSQTSGGFTYYFGKNDAFALNLTNSDVSVNVTSATDWNNNDQTPAGPITPGTGNMDGFGSFNFILSGPNSYNDQLKELKFTLTLLSGPTWSSIDDLLLNNSNGASIAAHISVAGTGAAISTGFAAGSEEGTGITVPEPGTMLLLGFALVGLAGVRRFKK